jgi:hypothetical protein
MAPNSPALAQDCAELYHLFAANFDKLKALEPESPVLDSFVNVLEAIKLRLDSLSEVNPVIVEDVGRVVTDDRESFKESEDERRMILTLCKGQTSDININGHVATIMAFHELKSLQSKISEPKVSDIDAPHLPYSIISTSVSSTKKDKLKGYTNSAPSLIDITADPSESVDGSIEIFPGIQQELFHSPKQKDNESLVNNVWQKYFNS